MGYAAGQSAVSHAVRGSPQPQAAALAASLKLRLVMMRTDGVRLAACLSRCRSVFMLLMHVRARRPTAVLRPPDAAADAGAARQCVHRQRRSWRPETDGTLHPRPAAGLRAQVTPRQTAEPTTTESVLSRLEYYAARDS